MRAKHYSGKYMAPRPGRWLAWLAAALVCLAAALMGRLFWSSRSAQRDFQQLSERVQSAAQTTDASTAAPSGTAPEETVRQVLPEYQALSQENPDFFGWIAIADTRIDYPVMHTPQEPEKYLRADFQGQHSTGGTPFVDAHCAPDSDNLIIYGHNMTDGSMFRDLVKYEQKSYWQQHPTITFNTLYEKQEFEVLAAFYDRVYKKQETCFKFYKFIDAADAEAFDDALENFRSKALYDTGVTAEYGDQLITLVTCSYHVDNGRFVVVARRKS